MATQQTINAIETSRFITPRNDDGWVTVKNDALEDVSLRAGIKRRDIQRTVGSELFNNWIRVALSENEP